MFGITLRLCPSCRQFSLRRENYLSRVYVCERCKFSVNEWNLHTYSASYSTAPAPKPEPKPLSFGRTKTKKPTKEQLKALSDTIDANQGVTDEILS